ncbi:MAG: hypothetical protein ACTSYC_00450 [Promethearchaeota archaeon]
MTIFFKDKISRSLSAFIAVNYILIGIFQNIVITDQYGVAIVMSNMILDFVIAFFFLWEALIHRNILIFKNVPKWKYLIILLAFLNFWWPMDELGQWDFNPIRLIMNVGILAYCSVTPIYLTILLLIHPRVNLATTRVASFIGLYFGVLNFLYWFVLYPNHVLATLHLPLLIISFLVLIISRKTVKS